MKFRPLHDRVLIKVLDSEEKTAGGIIIPDTAKEKPQEGEVVAVGPGSKNDNGKVAPIGWALCDGKNGTPDLRGRFIYGYGSNQGSVFGKTGGAEVHQLNINEMPAHNHSMQNAGNHRHETIDGNVWDRKKFGRSNGALSGGGRAAFGTAYSSDKIFRTTNNIIDCNVRRTSPFTSDGIKI